MANSFSAAAQTAYGTFYTRLGQFVLGFEKVCPVLTDMPEATSRKFTDLTGLGLFTSMGNETATPSLSSLLKSGASYSDAGFNQAVAVSEFDFMKNPNIFTEVALAMADRGAWTIAGIAWDALATPDVTTHPKNGTVVATGGGTVYLADDFASSGVLSQAQINSTGAALSAAALNSSKARMRGYLTHDGMPCDCAAGPLYLMVDPANEGYARDLLGRRSEVALASSIEVSTSWGLQPEPVINPNMTSTADWALINGNMTPFRLWISHAPEIRITKATNAPNYHVVAWASGGLVLMPHEGGLQWQFSG